MVTLGLPLDNAGKPIPALLNAGGGFIPKGAKNLAVAKDFLKYVIQPKVVNAYLKAGLGRWLPPMPDLVKNDPFWLDPKDPHREAYTRQGLLGPTLPQLSRFQSRLCRGERAADLGHGGGRRHQGRDDAAGGGGESVEEDRPDPREVSHRGDLRGGRQSSGGEPARAF